MPFPFTLKEVLKRGALVAAANWPVAIMQATADSLFKLLIVTPLIGGVFLGTLLIVSIVTVRISDMVLDSRIGALDRTLGFLFGLGRGLIIVVVAYLFFDWLVPQKSQPSWVTGAKSRVVLAGTGDWLKSMLPDDPESTILKRLKKPKPEEDEPASGQRSGLDAPTEPGGYGTSDRTRMQQLIRGKPPAR